MTEQEQKAFDQMREALEEIICAHPVTSTMRQVHAIVAGRNALTAANAVNELQQAPLGHDGKGCNEVLRMAGKAYPRTCKACGLGPCKWKSAANAVSEQAQGEASCGTCGNTYLATRTDVHKDGREFVYCDCCGAMADRKTWNRAHPQATEPAWRPIESAPKDGTKILVIGTLHNLLVPKPERIVASYKNGWWSGPHVVSSLTHWIPLPAAPEAP